MKDFYKNKLEILIANNKKTIGYFEKNLLSSIDSETYYENETILLDPKSLFLKFSSLFINQNILNQCNIIAWNLSSINNIQKYFGTEINPEKIAIATVSEDLIEKISIEYLSKENIHNLNNHKGFDYLSIENDFYSLAKSDINDINYIEEMQKNLEKYRKKIKPRVSLENIIDFCFLLNRLSCYLNKFEGILQNNSLELLQKMSPLRRKIDVALLEFRFIFEEMNSPILDIKIDRYKLLTDSNELKSIFLEKEETKKFIVRIEDSLQRKASNLKKISSDFLSFEEIKEIASSIDITSFDVIIDNLEQKKDELNEKIKTKQNELSFSLVNLGYTIVKNQVNELKVKKNGEQFDFNNSLIEKISLAKKEVNKNENNKNNENNNENENKKENENITNDNLNEISKSMEKYLEIQKMKKKINSIENQTKKLKSRKDYSNNFINILKLYNQFKRRNYDIRDDFFGLIIEDKKRIIDNLKVDNNIVAEEQEDLREFIIYEINIEKDDIY